jgi:hypothetical protein
MAQVWNPDATQVTIEGRLLGQQYINRFYTAIATSAAPMNSSQLQEVCAKTATFLELNLLPLLSNTLQITEVRARVMAPDVALQYILPVELVGEQVGAVLPNNVSACVSLSSGFAGRGGRGRMYVGGIPQATVSQSTFTSGFVENLNTAFQTGLLARMSETGPTTSFDVVIYSQFTGKIQRTEALLTTVTSAALRDNIVDSQRRRLPGRGA